MAGSLPVLACKEVGPVAAVTVDGLRKTYVDVVAVDDPSCTIEAGEASPYAGRTGPPRRRRWRSARVTAAARAGALTCWRSTRRRVLALRLFRWDVKE